jgi:hypothetical protein
MEMPIDLLYITIFVLAISSCSGNCNTQNSSPDSSRSIASPDTNNITRSDDSVILVSSAQISPYKTINIGNSNFQLVKGVNDDTSFLSTCDKSFLTPEDYHVGMRFLQIKKAYRDKLREEPGWGYYIELPSKWNLQFIIGQTATEHTPFDTDTVTCIFKRH